MDELAIDSEVPKTTVTHVRKYLTVWKHNTIDHSIRRIVNNHNAEEEVKAKKEHREAIMLPFFSCHTFRHTFCTRFCENETNVKVIQAVMGHADINTTMDIYAEVTEAKKKSVNGETIKEFKDFPGKSPERGFTDFATKSNFATGL